VSRVADFIRASRAVGGLLAIVTLLSLVAADFLMRGKALDPNRVLLLLGLISALLGVDIIIERIAGGALPDATVSIELGSNGDGDE